MINKSPPKPSHMPDALQTRRNVYTIWGNRLLLAFAPLIITPLITNYFGLAVTGVWLLTTMVAAQFMLLEVGMTSSLTRLLARKYEANIKAQPEHIISTAFWSLFTIGLILISFSLIISNYFVEIFSIPKEVQQDSQLLVILVITFVGISLPLRCGYGLLASKHRFDFIQLYDSIPILIRVVAVVLLWFTGTLSLLGLGFIVYVSSLLGLFLIFGKGIKYYGGLKVLSFVNVNRVALNRIVPMSLAAAITTLSSVLLLQGSPMFIGYQMDSRHVTLITIPIFIYLSITPFFQTFATIISPIASGTSTNAELSQLNSFYTITSSYLCSGAFAIFFVIYVFGGELLQAWLIGDAITINEITKISQVLTILMFGYALSICGSMSQSILSSIGQHWAVSITNLITGLLGFVAGMLLVTYLDMGIIGATLGITLALVLRGLIAFPWMLANYFKTSQTRLTLACIGRSVTIGTITFAIGEGIRIMSEMGKFGEFLSISMIWISPVIMWIFLTWRYVVSTDHKIKIRKKLCFRCF